MKDIIDIYAKVSHLNCDSGTIIEYTNTEI